MKPLLFRVFALSNFLTESSFLPILISLQKQYMFVYRAIMEMAQFGDTEVNSSELKTTLQELLSNAGKTLELEFARLANMVDDRKSLAGELF